MPESFAELGLRSELTDAADRLGYPAPTALQRAAVPVLRRGGNAVVRASSGAGGVAAYGLAVLDRLAGEEQADDGERPRALVLVATAERATAVALSLARLGDGLELDAAALHPGWASRADAPALVAAEPASALAAVQASRLKLGGVQTLVLDGAADIRAAGGWDAVEQLTASIPAEAQRVLLSARLPEEIADYAQRKMRRALTIPKGRTGEPEQPEQPVGSVGYAIAAEAEKPARAALLLNAHAAGSATLHCRTAARARDLATALRLRGFSADAAEDERIVGVGDEDDRGLAVSYDVPFDADTLAERHAGGGAVLLESRELAHLRLIAAEAGFALRPEAAGATAPVHAEIDAFRERLRGAADTEDLGGALLVLEPLLDEFSAVELAAAASALLRRRAPQPPAQGQPQPQQPVPRPQAEQAGGAAPRTWARLFVSIGEKDDVHPGDLVGAITGEAGVDGDEIGRIDIRDTHSIVEVTSGIAGRVIEAMNGITMKGRSLRVDYSRQSSGRRRGGSRG